MEQFKNVSLHSLDVGGGRVLASGEVAELSADARAVHQAVRAGELVEVGSSETDQSSKPAAKSASNKSQES